MIYRKGKIYGREPAATKVSGAFDSQSAGIEVNSSLRGDGYKNNFLSSKRAGF